MRRPFVFGCEGAVLYSNDMIYFVWLLSQFCVDFGSKCKQKVLDSVKKEFVCMIFVIVKHEIMVFR